MEGGRKRELDGGGREEGEVWLVVEEGRWRKEGGWGREDGGAGWRMEGGKRVESSCFFSSALTDCNFFLFLAILTVYTLTLAFQSIPSGNIWDNFETWW